MAKRKVKEQPAPARTAGPAELVQLETRLIEWPEIRVTAYYREGELEMLTENLAAMGQIQPIIVVKVGENYVGVDGLHRWQAAVTRGDETIAAVVREGNDKDALYSNIMLNSRRGRVRASEQIKVLGELLNLGETSTEMSRRMGHSLTWVNQMLSVAQATESVRQALDNDMLSLAHAWELSQIENLGQQELTCYKVVKDRWTVQTLKEYIATLMGADAPQKAKRVKADIVGACVFCQLSFNESQLKTVLLCAGCVAAMQEELARLHAGHTAEDAEPPAGEGYVTAAEQYERRQAAEA
jgi:ParB family chromosome partitioning protein